MLKLWSKICLGIFAVLFVVSESFAITGSGGENVTAVPADWITVMGNKHKTVVNFTAQYTTNKITCDAGYYLNNTTCTKCTQKYYCTGGNWTPDGGIHGRDACPSDYPNSAAGNTSKNKCYKSCTSQTGHSVTGAVYFDNTNTCTYTPNNYSIGLNFSPGSGGTAMLYTTYGVGVYLDSARKQPMSTTANPITKPTGGPVKKVTFNPSGGKCNDTYGESYNQANQEFGGYSPNINSSGFITEDGLTNAKKITSGSAVWGVTWGEAHVSAPNDCARTGYTFAGWYSQTGGQGTSYGSSMVLTKSDITVYAHWTANKYTCSAGKYLDGTTFMDCPAGYYCPGGTYTYNGGIQGRIDCPANSYCPAGSSGHTACSTVEFSEQGTQSCTITHGTGNQGWSRKCHRSSSPAGSKSRDDCTGSQNCGGYTYNTCYVVSCETGYSKNSSNTACEPNPYKITYNCVDGYYGTSSKPTHEVTATFGMSYTIPLDAYCTHPEKPFGGWNFPSE